MTDLLCDYAWQHPAPAAIRASYVGVIRYLSNDPAKDITAAEAEALHAVGLSVGLVYETTATRAGQGFAPGVADRMAAEKRAAALGYPKTCPIFYAVDFDADPAKVLPYFHGVSRSHTYPVGVYGSKRVVEAVLGAKCAVYAWQTEAWSGTAVSKVAHLYQRVKPTQTLKGAKPGSYDEDVILKTVPLWGGKPAPIPAPKPAPVPPAPPPWFFRYLRWWRAFNRRGKK